MILRVSFIAASALLVAACGGSAPSPEPPDLVLARSQRVAVAAFQQGQIDQAARLAESALVHAYARDDAAAIADISYNLAVIALRLGRPEAALAAARSARGDAERRGGSVLPELMLVEAAALYRLGQRTEAAAVAHLVGTVAADAATTDRARFIQGLVAADDGDTVRLAQAIAFLADRTAGVPVADLEELRGRQATLAGDHGSAFSAALAAADLRREERDYAGMARALATAAAAAESLGNDAAAAQLYLRAGRSAAAQGASADAVRWLDAATRASRAAGQPEVEGEAERHRILPADQSL
ncbi:MAG: hypothetical protein EA406_05065 [Rhodospirillales bacterium]|nr:MAG: hypothetical protein EA406_05065 [Rhodospirillales bacterium]